MRVQWFETSKSVCDNNQYEENGVLLRGILMGCVVMKYFGASVQLEIVIGQMHHFWDVHSENWTHSK